MGNDRVRHTSRDTHKRKSASSAGNGADLLKNGCIGAGAALLFATVFLFLGAALCLSSSDPNELVTPVGYLGAWLAALLGGLIAVRLNRGGALPCGAICGAVFALFFWLLSLFFDKDTAALPFGLSLVFRLVSVLTSILGGLLGSKRRSPTSRHKRR